MKVTKQGKLIDTKKVNGTFFEMYNRDGKLVKVFVPNK